MELSCPGFSGKELFTLKKTVSHHFLTLTMQFGFKLSTQLIKQMYNVCALFPLHQSITRIIISPRPSSSKPGSYCSCYHNMIMSCYDFYNHLQKCWGGCYFLPLISFFPHPWPNSEQNLNAIMVLVYFNIEQGEWRIFSKRESRHF